MTQTTTLVSANAAGDSGTEATNISSTPNDDWVTFPTSSPDLPTDIVDTNGTTNVILSDVRDLTAISHRLVRVNAAGANGGNDASGQSQYRSISAAGFRKPPAMADWSRSIRWWPQSPGAVRWRQAISTPVPRPSRCWRRQRRNPNLDGSPLVVSVNVAFDRATGQVTWTLRSFDPRTGLLPEDPFAGFLPPNDATGRGDGLANFTVFPRVD